MVIKWSLKGSSCLRGWSLRDSFTFSLKSECLLSCQSLQNSKTIYFASPPSTRLSFVMVGSITNHCAVKQPFILPQRPAWLDVCRFFHKSYPPDNCPQILVRYKLSHQINNIVDDLDFMNATCERTLETFKCECLKQFTVRSTGKVERHYGLHVFLIYIANRKI